MKKYYLVIISLVLLSACGGQKNTNPSTATEAGRTFIRASLDGDFKTAEPLLVDNDANHQLFDSYKISYNKLPAETKQHYKDASYEINKMEDINDSTSIINYSNSYMHKPMEIKVVRIDKQWKIDFAYTFSGNLPID